MSTDWSSFCDDSAMTPPPPAAAQHYSNALSLPAKQATLHICVYLGRSTAPTVLSLLLLRLLLPSLTATVTVTMDSAITTVSFGCRSLSRFNLLSVSWEFPAWSVKGTRRWDTDAGV